MRQISAVSVIVIALGIALGMLVLGTALGSSVINLRTVCAVLSAKLFHADSPGIDPKIATIVWELRLPRVLLAFCSGGALALSGAVVQSVLKNQLASPYILGVSSGASLGAGLVILSGFALPFAGRFTLPLAGFIFALITVFFVVALASKLDKAMSNTTVVLFGMVFSLFVNALLTTLSALYREELRNLLIWQMGSFAMRGWPYLTLLMPFTIIGVVGVLRWTREMDILTFGDDHALSCGVEAPKVRRTLLFFSTLLTGSAVALSGTIGFVDLIAPHLSRRLTCSEHRFVLPMSFLTGGSLCVAADLAARTVAAPSELPVGAVTALIGAPFFVWVYFRKPRSTA
ncbi:MAG: iron ABC transporter permease [Spirochaetaceae bacterium]|jgi:iron complex transport system permease protein|nr:iron ABC transporter permease [Spirochaetaceae bacterium]